MELLEEVREHQWKNRPGGKCQIAELVNGMSPKERQEFEEVLALPEIQHSAISAVLKRRGIDVKEYTISRHRRGLCGCSR